MPDISIAITGSSGFVGTNFIKSNTEFSIKEIDLLVTKVSDIDFTGIDSVLHLAALVHQMKGAPEEEYFKINRDLAVEVAKKAKEKGVKHFVFMSTAKVFGESTSNKPAWDENSPCEPQDAYGKSKYEAEKLIFALQDKDFGVAIVRSPLVYGVGVKANMYNLIKLVHSFPILPLKCIYNSRSIVYVGNLIALYQNIIKQKARGIYIAGDQYSVSTSMLAKKIAYALNKKIWFISIPSFIRFFIKKLKPAIFERLFGSLELSNYNTRQKLNFNPPFSTEEGIGEMVRWYRGGDR